MPTFERISGRETDATPITSVTERAVELDSRFRSHSISPCHVLLVGPLPPPPLMGGIETGVDMLMHSKLAEATSMQLFNTGRKQDSSRSSVQKLSFQAGACWRFLKTLRKVRPRIVHVKTSSGINFYQNALYVLIARLAAKRVVLQLHSGGFPAFYDGAGGIAKMLIRVSLRMPHRLIALSDHWAEYFRAISGARAIGVACNATDIFRYREAREDRAAFGIPPRRPSVLFVSTRSPYLDIAKGLLELIPAMVEVRAQYPDTILVIAGYLSHRAELEQALGSEGQGWICIGVVGPKDKPTLYASIDIFALPSHYENMPNSLIEAMAAGVPSVATPVGAVPEMLEDGRSGLIVALKNPEALADKLCRLVGDRQLRNRLGRAAQEDATHRYDLSILERALSAEYQSAL